MKDPAFLFYVNDFIIGTQFFSHEQVGKYIRLLCAQHQHGYLTEQQMLIICGEKDNIIWSKFLCNKNGLFFNKRLDLEMRKRMSHSQKQRENALKRWHKVGICDGITTAMPLENENEIVIKTELAVKGVQGDNGSICIFEKNLSDFSEHFEMKEKTGRDLRCSPEKVDKLLSGFISEQQAKGDLYGRPLFELRKHFVSWAKKKYEKEKELIPKL